ncbi:DUF397 domain-containing protein [Saccharothrix deserti]|uniref:DUF397 domain-containing protein n=1 Tax=Saccharothrix deserti TaxID=2593674 RepID=UPI00131BD914|nr:DUF397 domain-containing protein [Saccharothrix deserti]
MRGGLLPTGNFTDAVWRKSSRSGAGGQDNCVEVAFFAPAVAVRDSKNPAEGLLTFPADAWQRFLNP